MPPSRSTAPPRSSGARASREDARTLLGALDRLVRAYQYRDRQRVCYRGLSIQECHALQAVIETGPLPQSELARRLRLDKSTTSRLVAGLLEKDHLHRERDPDDGRAHRVRATASGRRVHDRIQRDLAGRVERILADLGPSDRRVAIDVMGRLADDAVDRFGDDG